MKRVIVSMVICGITFLLSACSVAGHLQRGGMRADVKHFTPEKHSADRRPNNPALQCTEDNSQRLFLIRADTARKDKSMGVISIPEIVVQTTARTVAERQGLVRLDFSIDLPKELLGACRNVVITPCLLDCDTVRPLQPVALRGNLLRRVQERDYWQYARYCRIFNPDSTAAARAFQRIVKYPYLRRARFDSIIQRPSHISYYYSQEIPADQTSHKMLITLRGVVEALDGTHYELPASDTLTYYVSSMLSLLDTATRYKIRIVEKYATVQERDDIHFRSDETELIDTLDDNRFQLDRMDRLMQRLFRQKEFYIDSVTLTASASPEGSYRHNTALAQARAHALRDYLRAKHGRCIDTLVRIGTLAENWVELASQIEHDSLIRHRKQIIRIIASEHDPDRREERIREVYPEDYRYIREKIYPHLRSVIIRYDLRRVGMIKDTIHTLEIDSCYMQGLNLLRQRKYADAISFLNAYSDLNTAIALLSLGYDQKALQTLDTLEQSATVEYLSAIACIRLGLKERAHRHYTTACDMNERMKFRGNLDPEIGELLKD